MSISRHATLTASSASAAPWRFLRHVAAAVTAWAVECRARALQRRALSRLTDWQLRDIGVSRSEADREAGKWFCSR